MTSSNFGIRQNNFASLHTDAAVLQIVSTDAPFLMEINSIWLASIEQ